MRYLFGDSSPFPYAFNFLSTLESFLTAATTTVQLESESRSLEVSTAAAAAQRVRGLEELQAFHDAVIRAIQDSGAKRQSQLTTDYVQTLVEHANMRLDEARAFANATTDREQGNIRIEVDRRRQEIRSAIESFLVVGSLPTVDMSVSMQLVDGQNRATGVLSHPGSIVADYELAIGRTPGWGAPRKVSDFAQGLNLMVGIKRGLFSREVKTEAAVIDDYIITSFSISDSVLDFALKKKLTDPRESLVFHLERHGDDLDGIVTHPGEEGADLPGPVEANDLPHLSRFWDSLAAAVEDLVDRRERLVGLRLEAEEVFENDLSIVLVERLVKLLAPTVTEVAQKSPNPLEFSLKVETDSGRREEIYIKKAELIAKLAPLGDKERGIFAPLGILPDSSGSPSEGEINLDGLGD